MDINYSWGEGGEKAGSHCIVLEFSVQTKQPMLEFRVCVTMPSLQRFLQNKDTGHGGACL